MSVDDSAIYDLPGDTNAGLLFNYAVWTPGTIATLANVPWNSDYRDIVYYDNQAELDAYIDGMASANIQITEMSYARPNAPIRLQLPLNVVMRYNYIRVTNPAQPVPGNDTPRTFYYFINEVRHLAPNTTEVYVQLDVVQSFIYDVTFGRSYIEAGHIGIANENAFHEYGRSYLTVPEGFDLGAEYEIRKLSRLKVAKAGESALDTGIGVLVASTVSLAGDPGTVDNPQLRAATGSYSQELPNGANLYYFTSAVNFRTAMQELSKYPWWTQGIIGVWAFPQRYEVPNSPMTGAVIPGIRTVDSDRAERMLTQQSDLENWRDDVENLIRHSRYRNLKKFLTYPYCVIEMTAGTGNPLLLKPESWQDPGCRFVEMPHWTMPNPRIVFYPYRYNAGGVPAVSDDQGVFNDGGEFLDLTTSINNLPTFSVVNNSYLGYLASNAHSIQYQHSSADWSQQRTLTGAQLAYDQSSAAMGLANQLTEMGVANSQSQVGIQNRFGVQRAVVGGVAQIAQGAATGGVAGAGAGIASAVMGGINTAMDIDQRNQELALSNSYARSQNSAQVGNAAFNRDTNQQYAAFAANGDYRNSIAAINAKVQDARMIQPTTSGQQGGEAFNLAMYQWGLDIKIKMVSLNVMRMIGEHWLRFGYAVNRYFNIGTRLHCMSRFTYWKLQECYITVAPIPETYKQALRGIFEKGVTVWRDPADIGILDPVDNEPESGFFL